MRHWTLQNAPTGWLARWTSLHTAWLLFAPPAVLVGLRAVLEWLNGRQSDTPALALQPLATPSGAFDLLWPIVAGLALLLALGLLLRRLGWRRAMPLLGGLWLLLWLGGSAALLQRHLNEQGLFLHDASAPDAAPHLAAGPAPVCARVLANQFKPPSLRGAGGSELVLQAPGLDAPQRLLLDDPQARQIRPGDTLALQFSPGRFSGLFVTDWRVAACAATSRTAELPK
ncbi:MAG: hypothetical protein ACYCZ6_01520 [Polaromonas sp.]